MDLILEAWKPLGKQNYIKIKETVGVGEGLLPARNLEVMLQSGAWCFQTSDRYSGSKRNKSQTTHSNQAVLITVFQVQSTRVNPSNNDLQFISPPKFSKSKGPGDRGQGGEGMCSARLSRHRSKTPLKEGWHRSDGHRQPSAAQLTRLWWSCLSLSQVLGCLTCIMRD